MIIDWNSVESVSAAHWWAEILGFIFFGLLLITEIVAFVTSNRKDALNAPLPQRRLDPAQQQDLVSALSGFHGQKANIICVLGEEPERFATDFLKVLITAKWDLGQRPAVRPVVYHGRFPIGVKVIINREESTQGPFYPARALRDALSNLGLDGGIEESPSIVSDTIDIVIGRKKIE